MSRYPERRCLLKRWLWLALFCLAACFAFTAAAKGGAGRGEQFNRFAAQVNEASKAGNLALAEDFARKCFAVAEGGPDRMVGNAYRILGTILRLRGKFADAEPMLQKALPLIESSQGKNSFQAIRALSQLGMLYSALSRYAEAEKLLREVLARQLALNPDSQDAILAYNMLANIERLLGRYAEAEALLKKAGVVVGRETEAGKQRSELMLQRRRGQTAYEFAKVKYYQGHYAEAESHARAALKVFEHVGGEDHPDIAKGLTLLGAALMRLGHLEEAEPTLRKAVAVSERALGKNHKETAQAVWNLGMVLLLSDKRAEAEPLFKRAIADARKSGSPDQQANFERFYGRFLTRHKQLPEALEHYRLSLNLIDRLFAQTQGIDEATRVSFAARFDRVYIEALQLLLRLHAARPGNGYDREALAVVSRTQSRMFTEMLRQADADKLTGDPGFVDLRRQQSALKATLADLRRALAVTGNAAEDNDDNDGNSAENKYSPRAKLDIYVSARIEASRGKLVEEMATAEHDLAEVEAALWDRYPRYMELTQPRPVTVEVLQSKLLKPGETLLTYFLLPDRVLIFVVSQHQYRLLEVVRPRSEVAALVASARKPQETAASSMDSLAQLDPAVLNRLYETLFLPVEPYLKPKQRLLVIGDGPVHTLPLEMLVTRWGETERRVFEAARKETGPLFSEYAKLSYLGQRYQFAYLPSLSSLASVRLYRKPVVSYDRELVSFADPVFEMSAPTPATKTALATLTRNVRSGSSISIPRLPETADEARDIAAILGGRSDLYLREKAQEHTAKTLDLKTTRYLHFATHGLLGGEYAQVHAAIAGAEAAETNGEGRQRNLGVASSGGTSVALPAALPAKEMSDLLLADEPPQATGGARGQPALLLSLSGDLQDEDGLLTMGEVIETMDINAQLVVLSACNTAGENAEANNGEGFAGLTRAFMYAGARGLLVSHWSVESRSTQELMTELFRGLHGGAENLKALDQARERIRASIIGGEQPYSRAHPYFWAPFVYVGD